MYKDSKWAREIISLQKKDGSWGYFHSLPRGESITTEQALRRLDILGFTIVDEPIQKAVQYMIDCLFGKKEIPDRVEKLHNWNVLTSFFFSTWIRKFINESHDANNVANTWAEIITTAFRSGEYNQADYEIAYTEYFNIKPKGGRIVDFINFYLVSLIADRLDEKTESMVFDYILNNKTGLYYIYDKPLSVLPLDFSSKQASCYLGAIEILSAYKRNTRKLKFVSEWLNNCRNENKKWDMGAKVNDKIYFPLSDSWRNKELREKDCTYRIEKLLDSITQ